LLLLSPGLAAARKPPAPKVVPLSPPFEHALTPIATVRRRLRSRASASDSRAIRLRDFSRIEGGYYVIPQRRVDAAARFTVSARSAAKPAVRYAVQRRDLRQIDAETFRARLRTDTGQRVDAIFDRPRVVSNPRRDFPDTQSAAAANQ